MYRWESLKWPVPIFLIATTWPDWNLYTNILEFIMYILCVNYNFRFNVFPRGGNQTLISPCYEHLQNLLPLSDTWSLIHTYMYHLHTISVQIISTNSCDVALKSEKICEWELKKLNKPGLSKHRCTHILLYETLVAKIQEKRMKYLVHIL